MEATSQIGRKTLLDMNSYQWTVILAAWLGWGFDVFDGLLFNYVAPSCVPTLLNLQFGSAEAKAATLQWTGILTSVLLIGWAIGGVVFGKVADAIGRRRTLLLTMVLYSVGTAACALAPNIWILMLCRIVSSLGIGGEWAAGAAMVAEVVPEKRRVEAGALLYTSAPMGLFLATFITFYITTYFADPAVSWRYVFLFGLLPAAAAWGQAWIKTATNSFNLGGVIGTLLTIPAAKLLGRKKMFFIYYAAAAASLMGAFGLDLDPHTRLYFYFPIGLTVFGVFGSF